MKALLAIAGTALFFSFATAQEAEKSPFTGTWSTNWGLLVIKKKAGKYTGKFTGTIEGEIKEGKLESIWKQTNSEWGSATFIVSDDGKELKGTWGGHESSTDGGSWDGKGNNLLPLQSLLPLSKTQNCSVPVAFKQSHGMNFD